MFRLQDNVPEVYPDKSRDFQLFCRLFDTAFSSVKQSIDSMQNITNTATCDSALLPLLQDKLGFCSSTEFTDTELRCILEAFPAIMRYKGSRRAITYIVNLYSRLVSSVSGKSSSNVNINNIDHVIEVESNKSTVKSQLLLELLKYVLPTGYTVDYRVVEYEPLGSQFYTESNLVYNVNKDGLPELSENSDNRIHVVIGDNTYVDNEKNELPNIINIAEFEEG